MGKKWCPQFKTVFSTLFSGSLTDMKLKPGTVIVHLTLGSLEGAFCVNINFWDPSYRGALDI